MQPQCNQSPGLQKPFPECGWLMLHPVPMDQMGCLSLGSHVEMLRTLASLAVCCEVLDFVKSSFCPVAPINQQKIDDKCVRSAVKLMYVHI